MKTDKSKTDAEGEFRAGKKTGEWRLYDANGKLAKTTKHKG